MEIYRNLLLQTGGDAEEALRWMERFGEQYGFFNDKFGIADFKKMLEKTGEVERTPQGFQITPKGEKRIRQDSLNEIFSALQAGAAGDHRTTVLMVDISHSMILYGEDRITPAKKIALALSQLIQTRYPRDTLDVVLFGDDATRVPQRELMKIQAGPYHTNTRSGLQMARQILESRRGVNKQIFMITDGKPSAIREMGRLYKNPFGLDPKIVNKTLEEASYCRRKRITITTFMLATDAPLLDFVRKLTELNHGRIYETDPNNLGAYVFRDFVRNRRKRLH